MANLPETSTFDAGVYQIEETDPVLGGAPNIETGAGMSNIPHLQLARRTRWLKNAYDALAALVVNASTSVAGIVQLNNSLTSTSTSQALTAAQGKVLQDTKAPLVSPALSGTPTAPTASGGTNSTQIATTAFVRGQTDPKAPLASPALTGSPTSTTPGNTDNSTRIATTAFVRNAMATIATAAGFAVSMSSSGYIKLPSWLGGLIIQWGGFSDTTDSTNSDGVYEAGSTGLSVSWPIEFPVGVLRAVCSVTSDVSGVGRQEQAWISGISNTGCTGRVACRQSGQTISASYIVIGR